MEDAADALARARYKSLRRLRKVDGENLDKLGLPLATASELTELVEALKTEELQLPALPAAATVAQSANLQLGQEDKEEEPLAVSLTPSEDIGANWGKLFWSYI